MLMPEAGAGVALRVEVDDQHPVAEVGEAGTEVDRRRGLADAALLVGDGHDPGQRPGERVTRPPRPRRARRCPQRPARHSASTSGSGWPTAARVGGVRESGSGGGVAGSRSASLSAAAGCAGALPARGAPGPSPSPLEGVASSGAGWVRRRSASGGRWPDLAWPGHPSTRSLAASCSASAPATASRRRLGPDPRAAVCSSGRWRVAGVRFGGSAASRPGAAWKMARPRERQHRPDDSVTAASCPLQPVRRKDLDRGRFHVERSTWNPR